MHPFTYKASSYICFISSADKTYRTWPHSGEIQYYAWNINYFIDIIIYLSVSLCNWSLQLQMSIQGSFWVCQKKHYRWFFLRSLIRTWGTPYNLALGYIMQDWMKKIDLWLRNFLETTRFRHLSITWTLFYFFAWQWRAWCILEKISCVLIPFYWLGIRYWFVLAH